MRKPFSHLQIGTYVYWDQHILRLTQVDWETLRVALENVDGGNVLHVDLNTLLQQTNESVTVFAATLDDLHQAIAQHTQTREPKSEAGLSPALLSKADVIIEVVESTQQALHNRQRQATLKGETLKHTDALRAILQQREHPIGLTTYYKYRKLYRTGDANRAHIAGALRRSSWGQTRMTAAQLHLVDQVILRYGARRPPRTPKVLYEIIVSTLKRTQGNWIDPNHGEVPERLVESLFDHRIAIDTLLGNAAYTAFLTPIQCPSQSWFYTYLRWFQHQPEQGRAVFTSRYGQEAWEREILAFDSFAHVAVMPLQYVFADHWLVDVFAVDDDTRQQRHRLWLTALIDVYSRCILGISLLDQAPAITSIQSALHHAIWPKPIPETVTADGHWPCFGIPQQLFLDNAWAHHAYSLEDLARSISRGGQYTPIDLVFRPPYRGRYGALIERFFGHLSARMKTELKGAITSSHPARVRDAAQEAVLLYDDVYRFVYQEIVYYQQRPHAELNGLSPNEKWQQWMNHTMPLVPPHTDEIERLFWRMDPRPRLLTGQGIHAFGMPYSAPELNQAARIDRQGKRIRYTLRFDPDDISRIALFRDGNWVCDVSARPLRLADGSYRQVSLAQRRMAQSALRQRGESGRDWLQYVNEHDDLFRQRLHERRQVAKGTPAVQSEPDVHAMQSHLSDVDDQQRDDELTQLLGRFLNGTDAT